MLAQGLSLREISRREGVDIKTVRESVEGARKKFLRFFSNQNISYFIFPPKQQIEDKLEFQGIIDYINPKLTDYAYVLKTDTKYSPKVKLYYFANGESEVCKVSKKIFVQNPINVGNIIYMASIKRKFKYEKIGDDWIQNMNAYDTWIEKYVIK